MACCQELVGWGPAPPITGRPASVHRKRTPQKGFRRASPTDAVAHRAQAGTLVGLQRAIDQVHRIEDS